MLTLGDMVTSVSGLPPGTMLMSKGHTTTGVIPIEVTCAATCGQGDIQVWADKDHVWVCRSITPGIYVDAHDPWCHQKLQGCLGSRLQPVTMLVPEGHITARTTPI